jgi:hypothetical protein
MFESHIGIDYSGRGTPTTRTSAIQVFQSCQRQEPLSVPSPAGSKTRVRNWCRKEVAIWLLEKIQNSPPLIVGIDHGFSFPSSYFERLKLESWNEFIEDFCQHWPCDHPKTSVDDVRAQLQSQPDRIGSANELRLTERWSSSAKSVFQFDVQGSVAKSTHAGLPWLRHLRQHATGSLHFWPFDGWEIPEGKSVIAEVFPSIFRQRYPRCDRTVDAQDAYCVSRWLSESDHNGSLNHYFRPFLEKSERSLAMLEGWILGIM